MSRTDLGKLVRGDYCACSHPRDMKANCDTLPVVDIVIRPNNETAKALVDTGCSTTVVHSRYVAQSHCIGNVYINAFDGRPIKCRGATWLNIGISGRQLRVRAVVSDHLVDGVDVVLGVDVIDRLGGVTVRCGRVSFGDVGVVSVCQAVDAKVAVEDPDFYAMFDGQKWTVRWFWRNNQPVKLNNRISCYDRKLEGRKKVEFEKEVDWWIAEWILVP